MAKFTESQRCRYIIDLDEENFVSQSYCEKTEITRKDGEIIHTNLIRMAMTPEEMAPLVLGLKPILAKSEIVEPKFREI